MFNKLKAKDKLILFFCLSIIALCWFLIFNLDYIRKSENDNVRIGKVKAKGQDVRKKIGSEYFWNNITGSSGIHRGDSLFAGEKSSALIEFDNGDSLTLKENSLVKFENKKDTLSIDISFGQMQVVSKTKFITVKDCGKDILIEAENANFGIDKGRDCGDVQIKVKSGEVKLENKLISSKSDIQTIKLKQPKTEISVEKIVKVLERPRNIKAHIQLEKNNKLNFIANWDTVQKATQYELELSPDSNLQTETQTFVTKDNKFILENIKSEFLYYRLRANESPENTGIYSPIAKAVIKEIPQNLKGHIQLTKNNELEFISTWDSIQNTKEYEIEISSDPQMLVDKQKHISMNNNLNLINIKSEKLYYRVRANKSSDDKGIYSPIAVANTKYSPRNIHAHIQLLKNNKNNELEFIANWDPVEKAQNYEIEISPDQLMQNEIEKHLTTTNSFQLQNIKHETLYYRVRANESAEEVGVFSEKAIATVKESLVPPEIKNASFEVESPNTLALNLGWSSVEKANKYRIEISETKDFKKIKTQTLPHLNTKFKTLEHTSAFVRVRAENKYVQSDFSTPKLVSFTHENISSNNKVITKKCMVKNLNESGTKDDFQVEWQPIPMAEEYSIKVLDHKKLNQVTELRSRQPASLVTIPACGEYDVKVEAYDKSGRKISSEFDASKILYKTTLALLKPVIYEAEKGMDIFFQKGVGRFIWLKWNGVVRSDNFYKVEIASDREFKSNFQQYDVKDNKLLLKSKLQSGEYFWRVREYRADLFSEWSDVAKIRVISNKNN